MSSPDFIDGELQPGSQPDVGAAAVALPKEGNLGQFPLLKPIFEFTPNGWHLPRGLANRPAYHIQGDDALVPYVKRWKLNSKNLERSALP